MSHPRRRRTIGVLSAVTLTIGGLGALPQAANAEPATPVAYRADSSATVARGLGFDTCTAPSLAALRAWYSSSYRTVNVYFGGISRACGQPNLTSTWVVEAARMSWRLLPTYVGRQPPCVIEARAYRYTASNATSYRASEASDVAKARSLACAAAAPLRRHRALRPIRAVLHHRCPPIRVGMDEDAARQRLPRRRLCPLELRTARLVRVVLLDGLRPSRRRVDCPLGRRPGALRLADGAELAVVVPPASKAVPRRPLRDVVACLYIDSDSLDAPVATVALPYRVTSAASLNARSGPSTSYPIVATYFLWREPFGDLPDRRQEGRVHPGLGPLDQRRVGHRLLRLDAVEDDILCAAAKVQVPGTGHQFGNTQRAERPGTSYPKTGSHFSQVRSPGSCARRSGPQSRPRTCGIAWMTGVGSATTTSPTDPTPPTVHRCLVVGNSRK